MPELPEVETIKNGLMPAMQGQCFKHVQLNRENLRFAFSKNFTARLDGQKVEKLSRRAKFLLAELSSGEKLLMHLGMSGSFIIGNARAKQKEKHDHVIFEMSGGARIIYNDPRRFGFMEILEKGEQGRLANLGPEPLSNHFSGAVLAHRLANKKSPIKTALLDQRLVAGLGNIYVLEALFAVGISPKRPACDLSYEECAKLATEIKQVLQRAIRAGGSTLNDFAHADGNLGYFQHSFLVYGRKGEQCLQEKCGGKIIQIKQSGRSSFYCPKCQN